MTHNVLGGSINLTQPQSINQSIDLYCITKKIVTQWVQAKLDKFVTSLSQQPINYYYSH